MMIENPNHNWYYKPAWSIKKILQISYKISPVIFMVVDVLILLVY